MGVYALSGHDDDVQLGLKIGPIKIGTKKLEAAVRKVSAPALKLAAPIASFIPGGGLVTSAARAAIPGIAKPKPKAAKPAAPPKPAGSPSVQVQRALSQHANRPAAVRRPAETPEAYAAAGKQWAPGTRSHGRPYPKDASGKFLSPYRQRQLQRATPATAVSAIKTEVVNAKKKLSLASRVVDGVKALRAKQRRLSDTARRAAGNAQSLQHQAEAAAKAGDSVGARRFADQARKVARVAQVAEGAAKEVAQTADQAGAAVSAGTTAAIAAGATGSESAGLATAGIVGLIKENPIAAAVVGGGALFVLARAFGPRGGRR